MTHLPDIDESGRFKVLFDGNKPIISLEEILELLTREDRGKNAVLVKHGDDEKKSLEELSNLSFFMAEEEKRPLPNLLLYELPGNSYYVYVQKKREEEDEEKSYNSYSKQPALKPIYKDNDRHSYGLFIPTGVVVRRVPQSVLGNGVLGRAFIHQNYIEVLDSLVGHEYTEVLQHEVFHIIYPDKHEMDIRQMTKNYVGEKAVYH